MRILLTQGRSAITLDLARQLHSAGHAVFVIDTIPHTVCRYSTAVQGSYVVPSPRGATAEFLHATRRIVDEARIERIVPVFEEALYLATDPALKPLLFAAALDVLDRLHNKFAFAQAARESCVSVVQTTLLTSIRDLAQLDRRFTYAIKPCYARAAQALVRLTPDMPMPAIRPTPDAAFVAQRWVDGRRFCSYSVCQAGQVRAHVVYPVQHTVDGHSCVYFQALSHAKIDRWVSQFAANLHLDGQIAIDFIETAQGALVAIECNPRATSGVHLLGHNAELAAALCGSDSSNCFQTGYGPARQVAFGMLLYGWRKHARGNTGLWAYIKDLLSTRDVVFDWRDLRPWLMQPLALWALWRQSRLLGMSLPNAFLYDFEWDASGSTDSRPQAACTDERRYA